MQKLLLTGHSLFTGASGPLPAGPPVGVEAQKSLHGDLPCPGPDSAAASMLRSQGRSCGYPANFLR